jgi:glucokinase
LRADGITEGGLTLGVDIGGTKVAVGLVDRKGMIHAQSRGPMVAVGEPAEGLAAVSAAINSLLSNFSPPPKIEAVGVCAPGPLNPITGVIINPPNLPIWRNYPLAEELRGLYNVSIKIDNDANAAALAEVRWGAGRGFRNVFYATIGTGIGTGIVFDGKIYHGRTGAAGEGGHVGVDINGPVCNCGKRGCIEAQAAGPAIARSAREKLSVYPNSVLLKMSGGNLEVINSYMVADAYTRGDTAAKEVLEETFDLLAYWLGNIIDLLEPDILIIGGGVSKMLAPFLDTIRSRWQGGCLNPTPLEIPLVLAHYGEDAGIAGAAALCELD